MIKDATTCDNRYGFGRSILDDNLIFAEMTTAEYAIRCFAVFDVHTRKNV